MFEQLFKNVDDVLRKEAGCTTELDYTEQTSWLLFLKYLDALEEDRATEAQLQGKKYAYLLEKPFRWETWAAPKGKDAKIDHNKALTGDDLRDFVNGKLFPYLQGFKQRASGPNTIEYKIGEIFGEIKNEIQGGYNLREIIDHIDELRFRSQTEKHELSHLYEAKIRNMGNAGRNGGEYYTPRPLIRAIIKVVKPKIGERIYDGACGSAGFLCESFEYMKANPGNAFPGNANLPIGAAKGAVSLTTRELKILQERTFFGKEKKSLAYVIGIMNMILHGIEAPRLGGRSSRVFCVCAVCSPDGPADPMPYVGKLRHNRQPRAALSFAQPHPQHVSPSAGPIPNGAKAQFIHNSWVIL
jgi:type I restriction enzyme M protein